MEQLAIGELLKVHDAGKDAAVAQHGGKHAKLHVVQSEPAVGVAQCNGYDELAEEQCQEQEGGLRPAGKALALHSRKGMKRRVRRM